MSGLRAGGPVISATVDGVPVSVRILPDGIAGECGCPAHGLCAHAAAAVLAWVRTGTDADEPDLFEVLRMQDPDWLATQLAELAAADPALAGRLLAEAEDGQALQDMAGLRAELDEVLDELEDEASSLGLMTSGTRTARLWTSCLTRQRSSCPTRPMRSENSPIT